MISARPTGEFGGAYDIELGNLDTRQFNGNINIPVSDSLRARLALVVKKRGGTTHNLHTGNDFNDINARGARFSLDWDKYPDINLSPYFIETFESFNVIDGEVTLSGWWFDNPNSEKTVIVLHGVGSSKQSAGVLTSAGMLNNSNFDVVVFDYQDHGSSTCLDKVHGAGVHEAYNTSAVIEWLVEEKNKTKERLARNRVQKYKVALGERSGNKKSKINNKKSSRKA